MFAFAATDDSLFEVLNEREAENGRGATALRLKVVELNRWTFIIVAIGANARSE